MVPRVFQSWNVKHTKNDANMATHRFANMAIYTAIFGSNLGERLPFFYSWHCTGRKSNVFMSLVDAWNLFSKKNSYSTVIIS